MDYCLTFKMNGMLMDTIHLMLFPFSLINKTEKWFIGLPSHSIHRWDKMYQTFFNKYFSLMKALQIRGKINSFYQRNDDNLYESWQRFKDLQK